MADTVKLTIDGKEVAATKGMNLIEAAKIAGIEVPHYCYHPKLTIAGNCRMCLCDVGMPKLDKDKKPEIGPDGKPVIMFAPKLEKPTLSVVSVQLLKGDQWHQDLKVRLRVQNPNDRALPVKGLSYQSVTARPPAPLMMRNPAFTLNVPLLTAYPDEMTAAPVPVFVT